MVDSILEECYNIFFSLNGCAEDKPQYPIITSGGTGTNLVENSGAEQVVYTITANPQIGGPAVDGYIIQGLDVTDDLLSVDYKKGDVTLIANPDYENKKIYKFYAYATTNEPNGTSKPLAVTFSITNANDKPTGSVTIAGTPTQGETLTANNDLADADGLETISYQWKRGDSEILGATSETYVLTQADVGKAIKVTASYTDGQGTAESVTSSATSLVANTNDDPTGSVTIAGTPTQGETLTANNDLADADGLGTISYQWKRGDSEISGAISSTYVLTQEDVGNAITVTVSYTDDQGTAESVTSSATSPVDGQLFYNIIIQNNKNNSFRESENLAGDCKFLYGGDPPYFSSIVHYGWSSGKSQSTLKNKWAIWKNKDKYYPTTFLSIGFCFLLELCK